MSDNFIGHVQFKVVLTLSALAAACTILSTSATAAQPTPLKLLFLGDNGHHQPIRRFEQFQPVMADRGIEIVYTDRVTDLNPQTLDKFAGLVLYANIDRIEDDQAKALLDFVAGGKGFIPLHCASYCFRNNAEVVALIGAQFQRHGTGTFRTTVVQPDHPIMRGFKSFESWDETYVHTKHNEKDRVVLEIREDENGKEPWTWVRTHGKGRVFYTAWGHDERTWSHPGFQNLVERGIRWACGDDPSQIPAFVDRPEMTPKRKDVKPFEFVDARIPFYPPSRQWGTLAEPINKMQKPLPAAESLKHFVTPVGFHVELFASEPEIGKPLAMNWDERGRLWLCETVDYPNELQTAGEGRDRIRICEDTDGDGKADKFTVFAEQLSIPTAIAFYRGGAIVQDGTQTVYLKDLDGDDKADLRKVLVTGWALGDTHGGVSNFQYGLDNWYYAMQGYNNSTPVYDDGRKTAQSFRMGFFRFKVEGDTSAGRAGPAQRRPTDTDPPSERVASDVRVTEIEFLRSTNNNTWGLGISEDGLIFGSTANGNPSEFMPIPNRYYESVRGWSASVLNGIAGNDRFEPITENVRQVDHHGGFTAAAGHALYTARAWPQEYWNRTAFVTEPTGHLVATFVLRPDGAGFRSKNSWNILASDDEWAAPIMAEVGPDGQLWVIDWYNIIVQHNPTPAGFKTGKGNAYEIDLRDKKHGRVYRVVYSGATDKAGGKSKTDVDHISNLADATPAQLVATLKDDNFLVRRNAQRLLVQHGKKDVVPALVALLNDHSADEVGLNGGVVHALWTLHALGAIGNDDSGDVDQAIVTTLLNSESASVVRNALLVLPPTLDFFKRLDRQPNSWNAQVELAYWLWIAGLPPHEEIGRVVAKALMTGEGKSERFLSKREAGSFADRWILDAVTAAGSRHDFGTLTAIVRNEQSANLSDAVRERLQIVAEHYARGVPLKSINSILEILPRAKPQDAATILAGIATGWPRDKHANLSPASEQALVSLVTTLPAASRGSLVSLASKLGSKAIESHVAEIAASFFETVRSETAKDDERSAAAVQLIEFRKSDANAVSELLEVITPRTPPDVARGILEATSKSETAEAGSAVIARFAALTPSTRPAALRMLLSRGEWTKSLLDALEAGQIPLNDLSLDQKQALAAHPERSVARRARELLAKGGGLPNPDRQKVLEELLPLTKRTGDVALGKEVFKKQCSKCHMHSGEGNKVGPDLTGMAVHAKHELLVHLIDPSRNVEGNFRVYTVVLADGRVMSGLLASESKTAIEIIDSEAKRHALQREDVDELVVSSKSLMPEGFEKQVPADDIVNLLEFLTARGKYLPIPLDKHATVVSTKGMFHSENAEAERLVFSDWKPKVFEGVPFLLVDPQGDRVPNAILLHSTNGSIPPRMPRRVTLPCNAPAKTIHFLSGVGGWSFPALPKGSVSLIVRLNYADGQTEEHELINGVHFADYIRRVDVPDSKFAFQLRGQQLRYLTIAPKRTERIESIELVKGPDRTSPVIMAVTVEAP